MKVKIEETFTYGGDEYKQGETADLPEAVAESSIEKGYAIKMEEIPEVKPSKDKDVEARTKSVEEIAEELKGRLDEPPEVPEKWNPSLEEAPDPEEYPELVGKVELIGTSSEYDTKFANVRPLDGGKLRSLFAHRSLSRLFSSLKEGDILAVSYEGIDKADSGRDYISYRYELSDEQGNTKVSR